MIWLRASAYGTDYPIEVMNPKTGKYVEVIFDLSTLNMKPLKVKPDEEGLFSFTLERASSIVKFRLLTARDVEEIEEKEKYELDILNKSYSNTFTDTLEKHFVEVNGNRDRQFIKEFISNLPYMDGRKFATYVKDISSGMDTNITLMIPGGESIKTTFPFNRSFFWPEF